MIAIDPGKKGGIAFFDEKGAGAFKMPDTDREILDLIPKLREGQRGDVYLEDLVKFTGVKMPGSSMATYAGNWGFIRGILTAYGYRIVIVLPKAWQKALGLGSAKSHANKTAWKHHLKNRAQQLYPALKVTDMTQDALLILEAARRGLIG